MKNNLESSQRLGKKKQINRKMVKCISGDHGTSK